MSLSTRAISVQVHAFPSLRLESMPLLASAKTRKQLSADKRARDAEKAFAREQVERRENLRLSSKNSIAQAIYEVIDKSRDKAIAHAKSKPSKGRDAQGLLVSLEAPKVVKDKLKKVEVVKPSPWLPKLETSKFHKLDMENNKVVRTPVKKLDNKLVHTPVKKLVKVVHVDSPKVVKDKITNKEKMSFEKKFEEASEGERDFSAFPDLDWAGFPSQSSQSGSS
jgi:hypothetical protein